MVTNQPRNHQHNKVALKGTYFKRLQPHTPASGYPESRMATVPSPGLMGDNTKASFSKGTLMVREHFRTLATAAILGSG